MPHPTLLTSNTKVSLIPLPVQKKIKGKRGEPGDNLSHEKITNGQMNELAHTNILVKVVKAYG